MKETSENETATNNMFALWPGDQLNFSIFIKPTFGFAGQPAASKAGHIANTNVVGNALTNDMKLKLSILTFLTLTVLQVQGQVVKKCDDKILLGTSKRIGTLNQKEITDFLLTFGQECRDNAEFSEWSNELLFKILDKQTELTLRTLEKEQGKIEIKTILDDLSEPITDNVNIKSLISKIERVTFDDKLKNKIITNLKLADDKD